MDNALKTRGDELLMIARDAISSVYGKPLGLEPSHPSLEVNAASFVTLQFNNQLRGCIGSIDPHRSLLLDVKGNAVDAAFNDPRFEPVTLSELDKITIEVSVLTPRVPVNYDSSFDLYSQLKPGVDGVFIEYGQHRGTFLPQVWQQLPDKEQFFMHLRAKAGLSPDFWSEDLKVFRYRVQKWSEADPFGVHYTDGDIDFRGIAGRI